MTPSTANSGAATPLTIGLNGAAGAGTFPNDYLPSLDGFQVAMQEQDLTFDRNEDGIVSIADALILIQEHAAAAAQAEEESCGDDAPDAQMAGNSGPAGPMLQPSDPGVVSGARENKLAALAKDIFNELRNAGATHPPPDLKGIINQLPVSSKEKQFVFDRVTQQFDGLQEKLAAKKAGSLAGALQQRFEQAGFVDRPPVNTPQLVRSLELPTNLESQLLQKMAERYKEGLGINLYT
jgi:hypothetical protein